MVILLHSFWVINSHRLGRRSEFMFSTVLDCRQSLSEVILSFFSTWLRGHGLGCTALAHQHSKTLTPVSNLYSKALINVRWFLIIKVQQNWSLCSARIIRFSVFSTSASLRDGPSLSYHNGDLLYCCSLAGAWTGIYLWVYCLIQLYKQHTVL